MRGTIILFCLGCCLGALPASAQSGKYVPGYYISAAGDTISGFIRQDVSMERKKAISFKDGVRTSTVRRIAVDDLRGVFIEPDQHYRVHRLDSLALFLREIVRGEVGLYRTKVPGQGEVYFLEESGQLFLVTRDNFAGFARTIQRRCAGLTIPPGFRFNNNNVVELTRRYNACRGEESPHIFEAPRRFDLAIGLKPAVNFGKVGLQSRNYYAFGVYDNTTIFPGGGTSFQIAINPLVNVVVDLTYIRQEASSDYVNVQPITEPETFSRVVFRFEHLEVPVSVQFGPRLGRVRPFIEAGLYAGIPLKRTLEDRLTVVSPAHLQYKPTNDFQEMAWGWQGGAGLGLDLGRRLEVQLTGRYAAGEFLHRFIGLVPEGGSGRGFSTITISKLEAGVRVFWHLGKGR